MNSKIINKLLAGVLVCGSVFAINPISSSADTVTEDGIYSIDENGKESPEWVREDGKWHYYRDGVMVKNKVMGYNDRYYTFDKDGNVISGDTDAIEKEIKKYLMKKNNDGSESYKNSNPLWQKKEGEWYYYFEEDDKDRERVGEKAIGWTPIDKHWYFFDVSGKMQKNTTIKDDKGNDCILNSDGVLINRKKPEFNINKGWKQINGDTYYIQDGRKLTGWISEGDKLYYLNGEGKLLKNKTFIIDNKKYVSDENGVVTQNK